MRLIEQESYQVSDPVTDFLQCLFTNYDFDGAQQKLQECEQVIATAGSLSSSHCAILPSWAVIIPHIGCQGCV